MKIRTNKTALSKTSWTDVSTDRIRASLVAALAANDPEIRSVIREAYAATPANLGTAPATEWRFLHHELIDGELVLNRAALDYQAARVALSTGPADGRYEAAAHLARHYRELGVEIPAEIRTIVAAPAPAKVEASSDATPPETPHVKPTAADFADIKWYDSKTGKPTERRIGAAASLCLRQSATMLHGRGAGVEFDAADLADKPEWPDGYSEARDFYFAAFRALSEHVVWKGCIPIDFGAKKGMLKTAVPMVAGRPFLINHWKAVDAAIGSVRESVYANAAGDMPAGINVLTRVNLGVPLAANMATLLDAGDITDVSVGVHFEWIPSHENLDDHQFWDLLGQEIDGHLVRCVVTEVTGIHELSLVWAGADESAMRLGADDPAGTPPQPAQLDSGKTLCQPNHKEDAMYRKALQVLFGREVTEAEAAAIGAGAFELGEVPSVQSLLEAGRTATKTLSDERDAAKADAVAARAELASKQSQIEIGTAALTAARAEAVRLYKSVEGDKADAAFTAILEGADLAQSQAFARKFGKDLEARHPMRCHKCGSTDCSRSVADPNPKPVTEETVATSSGKEILLDLSAKTK